KRAEAPGLLRVQGTETAPAPRQSANAEKAPVALPVTQPAAVGLHLGPPHPVMCPHSPHAAPTELKQVTLPPYVIGPPDILRIESLAGLNEFPVTGPHLVRPDGSIGLGVYGSTVVAGMTLDQARAAVAALIHARLDPAKKKFEDVLKDTFVDVIAYN